MDVRLLLPRLARPVGAAAARYLLTVHQRKYGLSTDRDRHRPRQVIAVQAQSSEGRNQSQFRGQRPRQSIAVEV